MDVTRTELYGNMKRLGLGLEESRREANVERKSHGHGSRQVSSCLPDPDSMLYHLSLDLGV